MKQSSKEVRDEYVERLGPKLGPLYSALDNEVSSLHLKWNQYRILFAHSPERVRMLNQVGSAFFCVIQRVLWDDILLHIARLVEEPQSRNRQTLSLLRLSYAIGDTALSREVRKAAKKVRATANRAIAWRHRHLAHRDLNLAIDPKRAEPLPGVSRADVDGTLAAMREMLNLVENHYYDRETRFDLVIARDDADTVAFYLEFALKAEEQKRQRIMHGRAIQEDLED